VSVCPLRGWSTFDCRLQSSLVVVDDRHPIVTINGSIFGLSLLSLLEVVSVVLLPASHVMCHGQSCRVSRSVMTCVAVSHVVCRSQSCTSLVTCLSQAVGGDLCCLDGPAMSGHPVSRDEVVGLSTRLLLM